MYYYVCVHHIVQEELLKKCLEGDRYYYGRDGPPNYQKAYEVVLQHCYYC
jgi:hypothetical protein